MGMKRDGQTPDGYLGINKVKHPDNVVATRAPTTADRRYKFGTLWIDKTNNQVYCLSSVSAGSATWKQLSS